MAAIMKTSDLIQLGALALVGYLAYQKSAQAKQPVATVTPGLQPSKQIINTPMDPNFGVKNPDDPTWGDSTGSMTALQDVIDWSF